MVLGLAEDGKQAGGRQVPADFGVGYGFALGFGMYGGYHGGAWYGMGRSVWRSLMATALQEQGTTTACLGWESFGTAGQRHLLEGSRKRHTLHGERINKT